MGYCMDLFQARIGKAAEYAEIQSMPFKSNAELLLHNAVMPTDAKMRETERRCLLASPPYIAHPDEASARQALHAHTLGGVLHCP